MRAELEPLTKGLRLANGSLGHRWIEGMTTPRFQEEWEKQAELPPFKDFLEFAEGRLMASVFRYRKPLQVFLDAMPDLAAASEESDEEDDGEAGKASSDTSDKAASDTEDAMAPNGTGDLPASGAGASV